MPTDANAKIAGLTAARQKVVGAHCIREPGEGLDFAAGQPSMLRSGCELWQHIVCHLPSRRDTKSPPCPQLEEHGGYPPAIAGMAAYVHTGHLTPQQKTETHFLHEFQKSRMEMPLQIQRTSVDRGCQFRLAMHRLRRTDWTLTLQSLSQLNYDGSQKHGRPEMHRLTRFALLVVAATAYLPAVAQDKPILAVMDIEDKTEQLKDKDLVMAGDYLRGQLVGTGEFRVVDKGRMEEKSQAVVRKLKKESWSECYDNRCKIELGREVAADTMISCRVTAMGRICNFSCEVIPLAIGASEEGGLENFDCSMEGLAGAINKIVARIQEGTVDWSVDDRKRPPPGKPISPPEPAAEKTDSRLLEWVLIGSGVGLIAVGGVVNIWGKQAESDLDARYPNDPSLPGFSSFEAKYGVDYDDEVLPKLVGAYALYGVGAVALATGAVLYLIRPEKRESQLSYSLQVVPLNEGMAFAVETVF